MSEFEIQAYLYHMLSTLGWHTRGELATRHSKRGTYARFDLVVFGPRVRTRKRNWTRRALRIIEVKAGRANATLQIEKYADWGTPIDLVKGWGQARRYIDFVAEHDDLPEPRFVPHKV